MARTKEDIDREIARLQGEIERNKAYYTDAKERQKYSKSINTNPQQYKDKIAKAKAAIASLRAERKSAPSAAKSAKSGSSAGSGLGSLIGAGIGAGIAAVAEARESRREEPSDIEEMQQMVELANSIQETPEERAERERERERRKAKIGEKGEKYIKYNAEVLPPERMEILKEMMADATVGQYEMLTLEDLKQPKTAIILAIVLGFLGADRFYTGDIGLGLLKLFTYGGFGILWIIDIFTASKRAKEANYNMIKEHVTTAY